MDLIENRLDLLPIYFWIDSKSTDCSLDIVLKDFTTNPLSLKPLTNFARYATASKGIKDEIVNIGQHANEELGELGGKSSRVRFDAKFFAISQVIGIAFGVRNSEKVWWDCSAVVTLKFVTNIVTAWP